MDIKIFSSMNVVIKDKIRNIKSEIKTLELRKESLIDKVSMQEEFIQQIEQDSKELIDGKLAKIRVLEQESDLKLEDNNRLNSEVNDLREEMVKFEGASDALRKMERSKVNSLRRFLQLLRNISSSQRIRFVPHVNRTLKSRFM